MEGQSQSNQAQLCGNGCGFYGSSKTDGMCSKCYKDSIQKKNNSGRKSPGISHSSPKEKTISPSRNTTQSDGAVASAMASLATTDKPSATSASTSVISSPISIPTTASPLSSLTSPSSDQSSSFNEAGSSLDESSPSKPKKNRCASCRKRLGLTGFYCRCGKSFCSLHRYSDQHGCEFDYKADAQAKIRKENPVVVGAKINKI